MRSALTEIAGVVKADVAMPNSAVVTINKGEVTSQQLVDAVVNLGGRYQAVLQSTNYPPQAQEVSCLHFCSLLTSWMLELDSSGSV